MSIIKKSKASVARSAATWRTTGLEDPSTGIYVDNAATSFPKPAGVEEALLAFHRDIGASAGRGAYPRAVAAGRLLDETRRLLARLFNIPRQERIIYTLNASDALN